MTLATSLFLAAVVVGTWNGKCFPSGDLEHHAPPEVEARTTAEAGRLLARGLKAVDPCGTNDVILCLNEIRGKKPAQALCAAIGRSNLVVAVVSDYRWKDGHDPQQDAILTTLPVAARSWSRWMKSREAKPPRGYAHADIVLAPAVTASVYAVHLKSNFGNPGSDVTAEDRAKRTVAVRQLIGMEKKNRRRPVVMAGDFNADSARPEFKEETLFKDLAGAGFADPLMLLPPSARGTHPSRKFGDSALDRVFVRGLESVGMPRIVPANGLSDHNPLFVLLRVP